MRTTRKILVLLAVVAVMVAALVITAFAEQTTFTNSGYADITPENGWVKVATSTSANAKDTDNDGVVELYYLDGAEVYLNEATSTLVFVGRGGSVHITGDYGDWNVTAGKKNSPGSVYYLAYWGVSNAAKVKTIEFRNVAGFNNVHYPLIKLVNTETIILDDICKVWTGTKNDTGVFQKLTALDTLLWGTWDKETGVFTKTRGEEDVFDLRGFTILRMTSNTAARWRMYAAYGVAQTSIKKLILPSSQVAPAGHTYKPVFVSDGTETFKCLNEKGGASYYQGEIIPAGKYCYQIKKGDTISYTTYWELSTGWSWVSTKAAEDEFGGDYTGIIPAGYAYSCTMLEEVVIPEEVTLEYIEASAFYGCTALKTINVLGSVATDMSIENKNAFTNVTGLTINVQSARDQAYMEAALSKAGVTGVTVVNVNPPEPTVKDDAVTADGYSIRLNDEKAKTPGPALRAEFTLVDSVVATTGLEVTDFGVIVFSADTYASYGSNIYDICDAIGTTTQIIKKSAKNGPYVRVNEETKDITFAAAITDIPEGNYLSEIYTYAYATWSDDTTTYYTYTSQNTKKSAHSLYDLTLYLFKNGLVNSENIDADKLFPVLEKGAVAYEGNIQTSAVNEYDQTKTHFFANSLHAYDSFQGYGSSSNTTLEETSSTNVLWSVFKDGDNYVAVYHKGNGDGEALLPGVDSTYDHPFSSAYKIANAKTPAINDDIYKKINTLVIDYGIEGVTVDGDGALASMPYVETIVYPNGFDEINRYKRDWGPDKNDKDNDDNTTEYVVDVDGDGEIDDGTESDILKSLLADNPVLKDIIWANNDNYAHMEDFIIADGDEPMKHLFDMRGMGSWTSNQWGSNRTFYNVPLIENIVFGAVPKRAIYTETFASVAALHRVWFETEHKANTQYNAPAYKTISLYNRVNSWQWGNFEGSVFNVKDNGYTLILNSAFAVNATYTKTMFFGADDTTIKVIIADDSGKALDPTTVTKQVDTNKDGTKETLTLIDWLCYTLTDINVTNRIYFYYPDTDTYKNPSGTTFGATAE